MTYANMKLNQYQQVNNQSAEYADPHRLIQMLMEGFITRTAEAKAAMERGDINAKNTAVKKACGILHGLLDSLDFDKGGELASNLASMYFYQEKTLLLGHSRNEPEKLDEVMRLMREVKAGWDGIRDQAASEPDQRQTPPPESVGSISVSG
ncbi:flagellar export chaperone FliS [Aquisalimonas asiatica]|uniref:Flagellar secretion chaperone FliS n=1 Tax=Aquisalimonas asiatica TaxID=406100 RepID=A0A1H8QT10_9GAMM|nr:flagellar export chaperone FliS [Aquisalimonas asiatica]SEO57429.1 flagellar protein FliS [Aquisalimonas asiatica]